MTGQASMWKLGEVRSNAKGGKFLCLEPLFLQSEASLEIPWEPKGQRPSVSFATDERSRLFWERAETDLVEQLAAASDPSASSTQSSRPRPCASGCCPSCRSCARFSIPDVDLLRREPAGEPISNQPLQHGPQASLSCRRPTSREAPRFSASHARHGRGARAGELDGSAPREARGPEAAPHSHARCRSAGPDREGALRGGGAARQQEDRRAAAGLACQERNPCSLASRELLTALNLQGSSTDSLRRGRIRDRTETRTERDRKKKRSSDRLNILLFFYRKQFIQLKPIRAMTSELSDRIWGRLEEPRAPSAKAAVTELRLRGPASCGCALFLG